MFNFVHLHVHSEYSLLDGLAHPKDLAARASELAQPALALTDHGTMFAAVEFYDACKAKGVKPIIGVEAYLAKRSMKDRDAKEDRSSYHLLLLAENDTGYHNLLQLVSAAQLQGYYYHPRIDRSLLEQYSTGLICTTGCPSGEVPRLLHDGRRDEARQALAWYRDVFQGRFYVELQEHGIAEFVGLDKQLIALAREFDLPLVATNDAHYLRPEDATAQDILLCIQTNTLVDDPKRMRMDGRDYYLKPSDEMAALWSEVPDAISNTLLVAERCNVNLDFKGYHLPNFSVPEGYSPETYLRKLCDEGFARYYPNGNPDARQRLDYELGVIHQMGFDTYYLIVWDLIRAAHEMNIWHNVRGSGAGSMAAYCAGITSLDPLEHHLIFERFLNPGRISMPDFDLDFPDDRRAELIAYTVKKYGQSQVSQIVTFGTLGAKAAIRDVGRTMGYALSDVDRVAKLVPGGPNVKLTPSIEAVPELKDLYSSNESLRKLIDTARLLEGVARHAGTHAAGVVISDRPIVDDVPLHRPTKGEEGAGFPVTQYEMGILERVGMLKMDFLGLATLSIMRRACDLIERRHGVKYDLTNIPVEDPKAFDLLSRGDVTGVFQVEGQGMRKVLGQMKPHRFEHIVATVALYRPGPMAYIPNYIARLHGDEEVTYRHPALEPILADTLGIMIYQEQLIEIAVKLAGYTASEGDLLRKAVGKKDKEKLLKERGRFIDRAEKHGVVTRAIAEQIFDDIEYFARYGFNRAHAADYAKLTCQTAFLKAHYPIEYMTALLTTETGDLEKIGQLVSEVRRSGIRVLPPDVNASEEAFTIDASGKAIHFSLSAIKNVGVGPLEVIVKARQKGAAFTSLDDFCRRVDMRQVNRRVLESLVKAGAMDRFGRRSQLLKIVDRILAASQSAHQANDQGQLDMFGSFGASSAAADTFGSLPDEPELSNRDRLANEKELTGVYFSDNPLQQLARINHAGVTYCINQVDDTLAGQEVSLIGMVTSARFIATKKGDSMAFAQIEDPTGSVEVTVFPKVLARSKDLWQVDALVAIKGRVELRDGKVQILCEAAGALDVDEPTPANRASPVTEPEPPRDTIPEESPAAPSAADPVDIRPTAPITPPPPEEPPSPVAVPTNASACPVSATAVPQPMAVTPALAVAPIPQPAAAAAISTPPPSPRSDQPRRLLVYLERADGDEEEVRRLRELLTLLRSVRGRDTFSFFVPNPQGVVQLDFPNFTTAYDQLAEALKQMLTGWGSLEVQ